MRCGGAGTGWSLAPHSIGGDWHYYADGGRALFGGSYGEGGRGGVHLFADHPELTTGPLSLLVARLLAFGADGWFASHVAIAALGLGAIFLLERAALVAAPLRRRGSFKSPLSSAACCSCGCGTSWR